MVSSVSTGRGSGASTWSLGRDRYRTSLLCLAGGLAVLGCLVMPFDLAVAGWCKSHRLPREVMRLLNFAEIFGHGTGVAMLMAALLVIDRSLVGRQAAATATRAVSDAFGTARFAFLRMVAAICAGGLTVDLIKLQVARVRPHAADLAAVPTVLGTFGTAALARDASSRSDIMSFPSGHSAVAAALAAALGWRYQHGRPAFAALALLAGLQRVAASAHYPSDVAFGAAIGLACAAICLGPRVAPDEASVDRG